MGARARNNPTAIAAKKGLLPPKPKPIGSKESKRLIMETARAILAEKTGVPINFLKGYSDI